MKIEIRPSQETLEKWIKSFVPENDLFFLSEQELTSLEEYLHTVLVIPREEFKAHHSFNQIQLANSYEYWNISKDVPYVLVAPKDWITTLPAEKKTHLFHMQMKNGRGLIYPLPTSFILPSEINEYVIESDNQPHLVLQRAIWEELSYPIKSALMTEIARQWETWSCCEYPEHAPFYLKKFANTFPSHSGSNCLSAVLFAITQQEWMIHEWVHHQTFIMRLKQASYSLTSSEELVQGDIAIWENRQGVIQHAAYHIGDELFFNKSGQTFFNPWKIVDFAELKENWNECKISIYRKT
ncbi:hypothetical protein ACFQPF_15620 [Fictibacillus iocasae]|uniref:NlpC/P60 domain-containing protein n=1 Tax=Fictibacillus iocasae TaxID=2715437 RepID=A0ABW2NRB4_9BACL